MLSTKSARQAGVPLIVVETNDSAQSVKTFRAELNGRADTSPMISHDLGSGVQAYNDVGGELLQTLCGDEDRTGMNPATFLINVAKLRSLEVEQPVYVLLFNPQLYWNLESGITIQQAVWNLRDVLKPSKSQLLMFVPTGTQLPDVLKSDVLVLKDTLPTPAELTEIIERTLNSAVKAGLDAKKIPDRVTILKTLTGLPAFPAEQVLAMSISREGVDTKNLWERKRQAIEQTPGLSVWRGGESFNDIGGYENVKEFMRRIIGGRDAPNAIVYQDEMEKFFGANVTGDNTGVTQDQLGVQLAYMQDTNALGCMFLGVRGSGKSAIAKAIGNEAGIPTIALDLGGMKAGIVGSSEARLRSAFDVVSSISQGRVLFIATCNSVATLPPELRRRYNYGTFFFDIPDSASRKKIWDIYKKKYPELAKEKTPSDEGWTGSEIRNCVMIAWNLKITLLDAAKYIVPVTVSDAVATTRLLESANNRYLDASSAGLFQYKSKSKSSAANSGERKMELD